MAYTVTSAKSGKPYYLHELRQKLKGGQEVTIYYFAKQPGERAIDKLPDGYEVFRETPTGLPVLRKKA